MATIFENGKSCNKFPLKIIVTHKIYIQTVHQIIFFCHAIFEWISTYFAILIQSWRFIVFFLLHRDRDGEVTERYKHKWTVPLRDVDLKVNSSISNVHNSLSLWTGDSVSTMRTGKANLSFLTGICLSIIITLCQFDIGFFKSFLHLSDLLAL